MIAAFEDGIVRWDDLYSPHSRLDKFEKHTRWKLAGLAVSIPNLPLRAKGLIKDLPVWPTRGPLTANSACGGPIRFGNVDKIAKPFGSCQHYLQYLQLLYRNRSCAYA